MKSASGSMLLGLLIFAAGITQTAQAQDSSRDYKQLMREFVQRISHYARRFDPDFIIIPQNGNELITVNGEKEGAPAGDYIRAISGVGREDLFYGYKRDNTATPKKESEYLLGFLHIAHENDIQVLVIDYCRQWKKVDDSYRRNAELGFISFAAPKREMNTIPDYPDPIFNENALDIGYLSEAQNLFFLLNPEDFEDKNDFLKGLQETNYDCLIIDAFFEDGSGNCCWLQVEDVASLKAKKNGAHRLVIAYMSIGEAETYRFYWKSGWVKNEDGEPDTGAPGWLAEENPNWEGNYKVRYWDSEWQSIIYGKDDSYLKGIIDRGFDGVYLDIIDAFEYFED